VDETEQLRADLVAALTAMAAANTALATANARIAELEQHVAKLLEERGRNSSNSGKPPSTDSPRNRAERRARNKDKSGRKRGGQPGHEGSQRALLLTDEVDDVVPNVGPHWMH
jgi:hypothetical protein